MVGNTPLKLNLTEGKHLVRITADDYDPFVRRIRIQADAVQNLNASLTPGKGTVEFQTSIPKAMVRIDDQEAQKVPIRLSNVETGTHTWSMSAPGYETKTGKFVFIPGQNLYLYTMLDSSAGLAEFTSTPEGADIYLNSIGEPIGQTPYKMEGLEPGAHTIILKSKIFIKSASIIIFILFILSCKTSPNQNSNLQDNKENKSISIDNISHSGNVFSISQVDCPL